MTPDEERNLALEDRRATLDGAFQLLKWMIATLFLLNGAAALAALGRSDTPPIVSSVVAVMFVNGLMGSLVAATFLLMLLVATYGVIAARLRTASQRFIAGLIGVQLVASAATAASLASSVDNFVDGVTMLARASVTPHQVKEGAPAGRTEKKQGQPGASV